MIGAIIGDICGSRFEFNNYRKKDFQFFSKHCFATDDSIMTLAVAKAVMESRKLGTDLSEETVRWMQEIGRPYPGCGYGGRFLRWMYSDDPQPYNSYGNGSAMRVSSVAYFADTMEECREMSEAVTRVTHNHPEGLKGAEATAVATWCALHHWTKREIRELIEDEYYKLDFTIDEIRNGYEFSESCRKTVPPALEAFFESTDFEDAIRTAVSVGGDSDTLACITGAVAGAYYGVPKTLETNALSYLDGRLRSIYREFKTIQNRQAENF